MTVGSEVEEAFVARWIDNAYGCFSSGHKFCREVCPVMQVTRNENHTPTASTPTSSRWAREARGGGRDRRLRPLHHVRRLRAPLSQHPVHR